MAIMVFILLTMLFMLGALVFTTGSSMVLDNGSYYLGITIPRNYRNEEAVKAIAAEYKKSWRVISLIGLVTCFMILFFYDYVSIQMVYIMVWFFALMYVYQQNLKKYGWKLYNWKITQEWYNSEENAGKLRRIDTAVTVSKDRMPVSAYWGIITIAGVAFCVFRYITAGFSVVSFSFAMCAVVFLVTYFVIAKSRTKVYCDDSNVNMKINKCVRFEWSRCMMLHSGMAAFIAVMLLMLGEMEALFGIDGNAAFGMSVAVTIMLGSLGSMVTLFITYDNIRKVKNQATSVNYYDDGDIYYLMGKKNPNAPAVHEKRIGIGFELNAGSKVDLIVIAVIMLFVIGLAIFMMKYDLADVALNISDDDGGRRVAKVEAAGDSSTFYLDEITDVELLDELPDMSKKVGYDGTVYYIGSFNVSGYGNCDTYVCLRTDMAVVVKTKDRTYVFNDETADGTRQMYESLR